MKCQAAVYLVVVAAGLSGCQMQITGPDGPLGQPASAAPAVLDTISVDVPTFSLQTGSQASQTKGGVTITVTPAHYVVDTEAVTEERETGSGVARTYTSGGTFDTPTREVERSTANVLSVVPSRIAFNVSMQNSGPDDFRPATARVRFSVNDEVQPDDRAGYGEFVQSIVPKRQRKEVMVYGPSLDDLPDNGTGVVTLSLVDVPTKVDREGNILDKQTFEWRFNLGSQAVTRPSGARTERVIQSDGPSTAVETREPKRHRR